MRQNARKCSKEMDFTSATPPFLGAHFGLFLQSVLWSSKLLLIAGGGGGGGRYEPDYQQRFGVFVNRNTSVRQLTRN